MKITFDIKEKYVEVIEIQDDKVLIPRDQTAVIKKAITFYLSSLENIGFELDEETNYMHFDLLQLKGMMDYPIHIDISKEEQRKFTGKYGVDFPEY
jgi:hypothetical protein